MPAPAPGRRTPASLAVLDAALTWTHGALQLARACDPGAATPCAEWDLRALLTHMADSLDALGEAAALGVVGLDPVVVHLRTGDLVDQVCRRARATRAAWVARVTSAPTTVGDLPLDRDALVLVGAIEVTVHGWDVARACGSVAHVPEDLAARLLPTAQAVLVPGERGRRFGPARPLPSAAPAADRLVAHTGRDPAWSAVAPHGLVPRSGPALA